VSGTSLLRDYVLQDVLADLEDELREALFALAGCRNPPAPLASRSGARAR